MQSHSGNKSSQRKRPRPRRDVKRAKERFSWIERLPRYTDPNKVASPAGFLHSIEKNKSGAETQSFDDLVKRRLSFDSDQDDPNALTENPLVETEGTTQDKERDEHLASISNTSEDAFIDGALPPSPTSDVSASYEDIPLDRRCVSTWQQLLSLLAVSGTNRFTIDQFEYFRDTVNWLLGRYAPHEKPLPSYSSIQRNLLPYLREKSFPVSRRCVFPVDLKKAGARQSTSPVSRSDLSVDPHPTSAVAEAEVILPSSWARRDVSFRPTWMLLEQGCLAEAKGGVLDPVFTTANRIPMVSRRNSVLCQPNSSAFSKQHGDFSRSSFYKVGTSVNIAMSSTPGQRDGSTDSGRYSYHSVSGLSFTRGERSHYLLHANIGKTVLVSSKFRLNADSDIGHFWGPGGEEFMKEGDLCTQLYLSISDHVCFLAHRLCSNTGTTWPIEIVWIPTTNSDREGRKFQWCRAFKQMVSDVVLNAKQQSGPYCNSSHEDVLDIGTIGVRSYVDEFQCPCDKSTGTLLDGSRFFVYRILLYSDGFSQYKEKQGSAGGIYMLPLNLLPRHRTGRKSVRLLGLTPPGVESSEVLRIISEDLETAATDGIKTVDGAGLAITVFIQVVAYVADFLEIAHVSDLLGHNADAACHLCSFRVQKLDPAQSRHGFTTDEHSADSCSFRSGPRTDAIRGANINEREFSSLLHHLGMEQESSRKVSGSPLLLLYQKLTRAQSSGKIPIASCGHPIFNAMFDPYRSVLVAPDHLLSGNAINILTTCFMLLHDEKAVRHVESRVCEALRANNLVIQNKLFDFKGKKLFSTSISGVFCTLVLADKVFQDFCGENMDCGAGRNDEQSSALLHAVKCLQLYSALVTKTYWYPSLLIDGKEAVRLFNSDRGRASTVELQDMSRQYVSLCDKLCGQSELAKKNIDKPNLHRLIELYTHSVAAMGHVRHFGELVFEFAHQPLKRGISRSNRRNPHLQAVQHALSDDWQDRLAALTEKIVENPLSQEHKNDFGTFLTGQKSTPSEHLDTTSFESQLTEDLLIKPLLRKLVGKTSPGPRGDGSHSKWVLNGTEKTSTSHTGMMKLLNQSVILQFDGERKVTFFKKARRFKQNIFRSSTSGHSYPHDCIRVGNAIQSLVRHDMTGDLLEEQPSLLEMEGSPDNYILVVFAVEAFVSWKDHQSGAGEYCIESSPFVFVRKCTLHEDRTLHVPPGTPLTLLRLTGNVRRVGLIHACSMSSPETHCHISENVGVITHAAGLLSGERFYYLTKRQGYPPRMG